MTRISDAQFAKMYKYMEENSEPVTVTVRADNVSSIDDKYGVYFNGTDMTPTGLKVRHISFINSVVKKGDKVIITMPKHAYLDAKWVDEYKYN